MVCYAWSLVSLLVRNTVHEFTSKGISNDRQIPHLSKTPPIPSAQHPMPNDPDGKKSTDRDQNDTTESKIAIRC